MSSQRFTSIPYSAMLHEIVEMLLGASSFFIFYLDF
jgi:hypothetical protein